MRWMFATLLCLSGASHAVLLTPSEAEALGERVCKPASHGMLDCQTIAPPLQPVLDERDPKPLKPTDFGDSIPPAAPDTPMKPTLDAIPAKLTGNSVKIGWDIGYGTTAEYWEVWDNGVLRIRSRNFTQRPLVNTGITDVKIVSVQSGVVSVDDLPAGRHALEVRLCNTVNAQGKNSSQPACTVVSAQTWVDGGQGSEAATGKPDAPQINWLPSVTTGEPVELAWNMWWGNTGRYWQVLDAGKVLVESAAFEVSDAHSQAGRITLNGLQPGKHALQVRLCSGLECAESSSEALEVILPTAQPPAPVLALQATTVDGWVVGWSLPRYASAGKPERWQWVDTGTGKVFGKQQGGVRECMAAEPGTPKTRISSWCGDGRVARLDVSGALAVRLCRKDECIDSAAFTPDEAETQSGQRNMAGGAQ
ncbi:Chitinase A, N-terminal domain [Andreprevotia lacus DSM 23236]|jgi:hypothetical protein|uniref:Chitinase A, N-terminal domain n=1 Tax=Andreprevotia lacus DSM 23236 TaxID=1121001 RepID=A0A1W1XMV1_9NEIS|nr:chitinase N-terminal domain-containing protein [Andreprevotia lacus]SMC24861.1 Chitinase A, N-terminal domain [Andreprevotia lacus DSM 23236]